MHKNSYTQNGFTLIEFMISITLGMLLIAMVVSVLLSSNRNYVQDERYAEMQENGRFALRALSRELTMAQFFGGLLNPGPTDIAVGTLPLTTDCGLTYNGVNSITLINEATTADIAAFPCIETTGFVAGSDVLIVKRASGIRHEFPSTEQVPGKSYLITSKNGKIGRIEVYNASVPSSAPDGNEYAWEYMTKIFYVRDKGGIPTLYMARLMDDGTMKMSQTGVAETDPRYPLELVEGVENMQVSIGLDAVGADGIPDTYVTAPTAAELLTAVTARINVLAVSTSEVPGYANNKVYKIGAAADIDYSATPDKFYRRVYSETILLRNTAYLRAVD